MRSVLLISHGSHSPRTKQEVAALVDKLRAQSDIPIFEYAFLEIESPSIPRGIENCIARGATHVTVLLNFLNSGKHVDGDIPRLIAQARQKHPQVNIAITPPVGQDPGIVELFLRLITTG